jgi:hypothetical protein
MGAYDYEGYGSTSIVYNSVKRIGNGWSGKGIDVALCRSIEQGTYPVKGNAWSSSEFPCVLTPKVCVNCI